MSRPLHLDQPGTAYDIETSTVADRKPISLLPSSPTRINWPRLPKRGAMRGMELAFRHQLQPDDVGDYLARNLAAPFLLVAYLCALILPMFAATFPFLPTLGFVGAIGGFIILYRLWRHMRLSLSFVLWSVLLPLLTLLVLHALSFVFANRIVGSTIIAVMALIAFHRFGDMPTSFYYNWLYTSASLRPDDRHAREPLAVRPELRVFALVMLIAVVVPLFSTIAAVVAIAALCAYYCRRERFGLVLIQDALDLLGPYLTYGTRLIAVAYQYFSKPEPPAPGVWVPSAHVGWRRAALFWIIATVTFSLALALSFFIPYEFAGTPLFREFDRAVMRQEYQQVDFHKKFPDVNLDQAPKPLPKLPEVDDYGRRITYDVKAEQAKVDDREAAGAAYIRGVIRDQPSVGIYLVYSAAVGENKPMAWLFVISLLVGIPICTWVLLAMYREPLRALARRRKQIDDRAHQDPRPEWQWYVDRIRTSLHEAKDPLGNSVREAQHLFLGVEPYFRFPILLDRAILAEHAYIVGESGSGKTALGIIPLLIQLIRGHAVGPAATSNSEGTNAVSKEPNRSESIFGRGRVEISPPPPIVVIDLKGDPALFHTIREECEERRRQMGIDDPRDPRCSFRFFSLEPNKPTHVFNPFTDLRNADCSVMQICQLLLDSLGLSHGEGYGRSYYSRKNRHLLLAALKQANPEIRSFEELYPLIARLARTKEHRECFELLSTIYAISQYEQIATFQPLKRPEDAIHMPSVLEYGQVVYFWLPAVLESISVREVAKLALFSLLTAAIDRQRRRVDGASPRQAYLVIDEFQRIAAENFKVILEQARSFGVSTILANQSQADLVTHDVDLRPTIRTNTRFKQYFAIGDPDEIADLKAVSGEEIMRMFSYAVTPNNPVLMVRSPRQTGPHDAFTTKTETEVIKTRLMTNDIASVSDHPLQSIIHVLRGNGYTQYAGLPVPLQSTWPMHYAEYRRRQQMPWPERDPYELETVTPQKSSRDIDEAAEERTAEERAKIDATIRELLADGNDETETN